MSAKCPKCGKTVYAAEEMSAGPLKWHKTCFKCEACGTRLATGKASRHEDKLYCQQCYLKGMYATKELLN
uniref:Cysteine-rich protein 1 n=1 Tax=Tetranychus urticae TaxID=32264 RepID=T1KIC6_TETUR